MRAARAAAGGVGTGHCSVVVAVVVIAATGGKRERDEDELAVGGHRILSSRIGHSRRSSRRVKFWAASSYFVLHGAVFARFQSGCPQSL